MNRKAIFLDIDGTMVPIGGVLPDPARDALQRAHDNGHMLVLCSGRSRCQMNISNLPLDLFDGIISCSGACVTRNGEILVSHFMDQAHVRQMEDLFAEQHMAFFFQTEEATLAPAWSKEQLLSSMETLGRDTTEIRKFVDNIELYEDCGALEHVEKAVYYDALLTAEEVHARLGTDYFQVTDSSFRVSRFCDGEVTRRGITKASGMEALLAAAGIPREDSIGIGDGPNDLEMIEYANIGVAMGNAVPALKRSADIIFGHIDHDGFRQGFQALGLI